MPIANVYGLKACQKNGRFLTGCGVKAVVGGGLHGKGTASIKSFAGEADSLGKTRYGVHTGPQTLIQEAAT
jgi:hypothetical protein